MRSHAMGSATYELDATVDQSDIRGLVTACQRFVAGLPQSDSRRPSQGRSRSRDEVSPSRARVSRCPSRAMQAERRGKPGVRRFACSSSVALHLSTGLPQESGQFPGHGHADLVGVHATRVQPAVSGAQSQLGTPGDFADVARLALLSLGDWAADWAAHARRVTVTPCGLDQRAAHVCIAGLGDTSLGASLAAAEFAGVPGRDRPSTVWDARSDAGRPVRKPA